MEGGTKMDRHFVATAFVCWRGKLLLHRHPKLGMWLPCGGHVEPGELPDEAAVREVLEEAGIEVELVGERAIDVSDPLQLVRPRGVQLERIAPGHEHVDLIYFARPREPYDGKVTGVEPGLGWYSPEEITALPLTEEMRAWTELALAELVAPAPVRPVPATGRE
jgi:8-oxo-dGTP pyrophosphatase MutT (NUDIX family)